jgi:hypothetical protein
MEIDIHNTEDHLVTHARDIEKILRKAVREAVLEHKHAGNPVAAWRDGQVVIIQPDEIDIDENDSDDKSSSTTNHQPPTTNHP